MKHIGTLCGILIILGAAWLLVNNVDMFRPTQADARTGVIDLLPYKTFLPSVTKYGYPDGTPTPEPTAGPTNTPVPTRTPGGHDPYDPSWIQRVANAEWRISLLEMFPCEESSGSHIVRIESRDRYNQLVSGVPFLVVGNGGVVLHGVTGDKSPGVTEVPLSRDTWRVYVVGAISDIAMDLREDIDNDPDCPNRFGNHLSYRATFQKVK